MTVFSYQSQQKPQCWGNQAVHNAENRECSRCSFQLTCRDEIVKLGANRFPQQQYGQSYGGAPFAPPRPVQQTPQMQQQQQIHVLPPQQPAYYIPQQMNYQNPYQNYGGGPRVASPQVVNGVPPFTYGWIQDPLHGSIGHYGMPVRVQQPGETFGQRVVKNAALSMGESFLMQLVFALRQTYLPPGGKG